MNDVARRPYTPTYTPLSPYPPPPAEEGENEAAQQQEPMRGVRMRRSAEISATTATLPDHIGQ